MTLNPKPIIYLQTVSRRTSNYPTPTSQRVQGLRCSNRTSDGIKLLLTQTKMILLMVKIYITLISTPNYGIIFAMGSAGFLSSTVWILGIRKKQAQHPQTTTRHFVQGAEYAVVVVYKDAPPVFKTSGLARLLDFPDLQHCHGNCPDTLDHVLMCGVVAFAAVGLWEVTSGVSAAKAL